MDWKDALKGLSESGTLPEGVSAEESEAPEKKPADRLKIETDKKGRHGKTATIIYGFSCSDDELKEVARKLKQAIGVGGSSRDGEILMQGDCREQAARHLREMGYKV